MSARSLIVRRIRATFSVSALIVVAGVYVWMLERGDRIKRDAALDARVNIAMEATKAQQEWTKSLLRNLWQSRGLEQAELDSIYAAFARGEMWVTDGVDTLASPPTRQELRDYLRGYWDDPFHDWRRKP